jgi:hypothetical protein
VTNATDPPDIYIYSLPTELPASQQDLSVPTPADIYGHYVLNLIAFLAIFFLMLNFVVKVKVKVA